MLAGLFASGQLRLTEPAPSRDHSERMLAAAGVALLSTPTDVTMACGQGVAMPLDPVSVPADVSGAAFFIAAASILPGSRLLLPGVGCNPTRTGFGDFLGLSGSLSPTEELGELRSDLIIEAGGDRGEDAGEQMLSGDLIPRLIDEIPVLGVLAAMRSGVTRIREAADLRAKETDRIETTAAMLRELGVRVDTQPDGMDIHGLGGQPFSGGGTVEASGDHRIAMAAAVGALAAEGPVTVRGVDAVDTSFPGFLSTLESVVER